MQIFLINCSSGVWELTGEGEKETPIQKCQRLQCEMSELMDEITALQNDNTVSREERESYDGVSKVVTTASKVLASLRLEQVLGNEAVASSSDKQVKNLISQVEDYKKGMPATAAELVKLNSSNELSYSSRVAELEHKLHQIELAIGAKPEKISRLNSSMGTKNLLEAVQQLSTKSALLQPQQLDVIEQRLTNLASKMDQFNDKAAGSGSDPSRDQKVLELYDLAKSTEPITKVLPDMLERMKTLESLHSYGEFIINIKIYHSSNYLLLISAANFSKLFAELEATQAIILKGIASNKELLQGVQKAFVENNENIDKEIKKLGTRVDGVVGSKK